MNIQILQLLKEDHNTHQDWNIIKTERNKQSQIIFLPLGLIKSVHSNFKANPTKMVLLNENLPSCSFVVPTHVLIEATRCYVYTKYYI